MPDEKCKAVMEGLPMLGLLGQIANQAKDKVKSSPIMVDLVKLIVVGAASSIAAVVVSTAVMRNDMSWMKSSVNSIRHNVLTVKRENTDQIEKNENHFNRMESQVNEIRVQVGKIETRLDYIDNSKRAKGN